MAVTIDLQNNPTPSNTSKEQANATVINSGFSSGTVTYNIEARDGSESIAVDTNTSVANSPNLVSVSASKLEIILRTRTKYKARANDGSGWTSYVNFTTRDKTYKTPNAIRSLSDDSDNTATVTGARTITVTDTGKATVVNTAAGATITNTDSQYVTTTSIRDTARGATINNSE